MRAYFALTVSHIIMQKPPQNAGLNLNIPLTGATHACYLYVSELIRPVVCLWFVARPQTPVRSEIEAVSDVVSYANCLRLLEVTYNSFSLRNKF